MLPENIKKQEEKKPIMLGAHYYLWYGRPVFPIQGGGVWKSGYSHQPVLEEYSSRDKAVIDRHIIWAKEAGLDFFAINWSDPQSWDDITLKDYYLFHPRSSEIKFCLFYDSSLALNQFRIRPSYNFDDSYSATKTKGEKFLDDLEYLADHYFNHPQYLKINNQLVVIIYNVSAFRNISRYFDQLRVKMAKKGISLFLVADVVCWAGIKISKDNLSFLWKTVPEEAIKVLYRALRRLFLKNYEKDFSLSKYFNGITGYNMYAVNRITPNFLENVDKVYQKFWDYACSHNLSFIPTVMPGYDDRNLKGFNRPILERKKGEFYKEFWKIAKKYLDPSLKMVLITSFNEWHEGTEIEPSKEHDKGYLQLTKSFKLELK